MSRPPINEICQDVARALHEDVGAGDITAALIPEDRGITASIISREDAILCGTSWAEEVFKQLDERVQLNWLVKDGDAISARQTLCELNGPARGLLSGERAALNFLQTLSATATRTKRYVDAVEGTGVQILDTRKTLPGMRLAQKYAVTCGGGLNHRMGLYDAFLIKENHIVVCGSIAAAMEQALAMEMHKKLEVEVEDLQQLQQAIDAGADFVLLDNFDVQTLTQAVALAQGRARLEASGGINLETIRAIANTGVDYISVGNITKNIHAIDLSMRVDT
ncbi:MAG: carboxylating nicotinate-nucleotide diphosphorylase [Gammaproteobacteria bacterium]|nr:MAG: carboxylating nicotinate-nucleotide diphosphorylase [Gammaproteobacteria bacterium]